MYARRSGAYNVTAENSDGRPGGTIFGRYADHYDGLYSDKDYVAECAYLERLFRHYSRRRVRSVLSLGCGTGSHDLVLAERGFRTTGVDRSAQMLRCFREKRVPADSQVRIRRGDIRSMRLGQRFDAVISMFAVIGYQATDRDLTRALATAAAHLDRGGLFLFDVWFGSAVLRDPPKERVKVVATPTGSLERRTLCMHHPLEQVVDITFETTPVEHDKRGRTIRETHRMRYFFPREIATAVNGAGLRLVTIAPFLEVEREPTDQDWNVMVVARAPG